MTRRGWITGSFALSLLVACLSMAISAFSSKSAHFDGTRYFRVRVGLTHKGVPIDFNVVVGCGIKVSGDSYSGHSLDVLGWQPFVYAKRIEGDHAVLLRTDANASPCEGSTSAGGGGSGSLHGDIPSDWLPLIVWYDDYHNLSEGLGYVTSDAYANPSSQLEFHGARIDRATKAEYDEFIETAPKNLIPNYLAGNVTEPLAPHVGFNMPVPEEVVEQPWRAWPYGSTPFCRGVERVKLPEYQRKMIAAFWPASHPHFWSVAPAAQAQLLKDLFPGGTKSNSLLIYPAPKENNRRYDHISDADAYGIFPSNSDWSLSQIYKETDLSHQTFRIEIRDGNTQRGMVACQSVANNGVLSAVTKKPESAIPFSHPICYFDGILVPSTRTSFCGTNDEGWITFEDDDYAVLNIDLTPIFL